MLRSPIWKWGRAPVWGIPTPSVPWAVLSIDFIVILLLYNYWASMWSVPPKVMYMNIWFPEDDTVLGSCGILPGWGPQGWGVFKFLVQHHFLSHLCFLIHSVWTRGRVVLLPCFTAVPSWPWWTACPQALTPNKVFYERSILAVAKSSRLPWNVGRAGLPLTAFPERGKGKEELLRDIMSPQCWEPEDVTHFENACQVSGRDHRGQTRGLQHQDVHR